MKNIDENQIADNLKGFIQDFQSSKLNILQTTPQTGPDGWPYLLVEMNENGKEDVAKVLNWVSDKGIGLVVNPQKETPDHIFTYGMIWNFRERNEFYTSSDQMVLEKIDDRFLPSYVRKILRTFFSDNGIKEMRFLLVAAEQGQYDLCFSLEAAGNPPEKEHLDILEAISWFLPAHYSLRLISEEGLPKFQVL